MSTVKYYFDKWKIGSTLVLSSLAFIWLIPTVGLLITSFRERTEAQRTGWWVAFTDVLGQDWNLSAYQLVLEEKGLASSFIASAAVTVPATVLPLCLRHTLRTDSPSCDFVGVCSSSR